ncbi:MAG: MarR family transcriptional regulator, partial [Ilumatobacteraceae bacterium]|nr:MarR family transcriptional regulator [Ilumatobacteraceae bacterium]
MEGSIGHLEAQMAVLARRLENASRKPTISARMDRAAYLIARTLDQSGPVNVNEIARILALDGSTVTRQLAAMESHGFVARGVDPDDGRAWVITLTDAGRREMDLVSTVRARRFTEILDDWPSDDIEQFSRLLERFNGSLQTFHERPRAAEPT